VVDYEINHHHLWYPLTNIQNVRLNVTSPAEQVVEQAKSEIKRDKHTEKGKHTIKRVNEKSSSTKDGRGAKKRKVVKIKSDVFGLY
jgi:hypothetical protein